MRSLEHSDTSAHARPVVIVIEDDEVQRRGLSSGLRKEGIEVFDFKEGRSALNFLAGEDRSGAIVISDQRMPGISGIEVLEKIRESGLANTFILITAYNSPGLERKAREIGAERILEKPLDLAQVSELCVQLAG